MNNQNQNQNQMNNQKALEDRLIMAAAAGNLPMADIKINYEHLSGGGLITILAFMRPEKVRLIRSAQSACAQSVAHLLGPKSKAAVEAASAFGKGEISIEELAEANSEMENEYFTAKRAVKSHFSYTDAEAAAFEAAASAAIASNKNGAHRVSGAAHRAALALYILTPEFEKAHTGRTDSEKVELWAAAAAAYAAANKTITDIVKSVIRIEDFIEA